MYRRQYVNECVFIIYYFYEYSNNNLSVVTQQFWLENLKCLQHVLRIYINHISLSTAAQNISVFLCLQRFVSGEIFSPDREDQNIFRNRHLPLTMRSLLFFSTLFFFFHGSKSDFASQLAAFINETVSEAIFYWIE